MKPSLLIILCAVFASCTPNGRPDSPPGSSGSDGGSRDAGTCGGVRQPCCENDQCSGTNVCKDDVCLSLQTVQTGMPCRTAGDCASGQCVSVGGTTKVCSTTCVSTGDCVAGWDCGTDQSTTRLCQCQKGVEICNAQDDDCDGIVDNPEAVFALCQQQLGSKGVCQNGSCQQCSGDLCGSSCVNTDTDPANCGSCGHACPTHGVCQSAECSCPSGTTLCGGTTCANTQSDDLNCGSCGHACTGGSTCVAGTCARPVGATCSGSGQGNCADGDFCAAVGTKTMCTRECQDDETCGMTGSQKNYCFLGICFSGCAPGSGAHGCSRSDLICVDGSDGSAAVCMPDCNTQSASFCADNLGYPAYLCDSQTGSCLTQADCTSNQMCSGGQICETTPLVSGEDPPNVCTFDCRQISAVSCSSDQDCVTGHCAAGACADCPYGFGCQQSTGACSIVHVNNYSPCYFSAQCPTNNYCVHDAASGPGVCFQTCGSGNSCPSGQQCAVQLQNGDNICATPCPQGSTCPGLTTCQQVGSTSSFCL